MNFGKLREVFVHNMPKKKNLHFLHRCHGFREMSELQSPDPRRLAKAQKGERGPIPSVSWLRLQSRIKALNSLATTQIPRNFDNFGWILAFSGNLQVFPINGSHPPRDPSSWQFHLAKTQHFQIFHAKLHMLMDGLEIWWSFGPPESKKTSKKWLSATFLSCRKQSWEIAILEAKMTTKFRNSSWVGKYTHRPFQQAYACSIWTPGSAPKVVPKARDPSGRGARPVRQTSPDFSVQLRKTQFDPVWLFGVDYYPLWCN